MKKILLCFLVLIMLFTSAMAAPLSPTVRDLYTVNNSNVIITFPEDHDDVTVDTELPFSILLPLESIIGFSVNQLKLSEIIVVECLSSVKNVTFHFPTSFDKNETVINIFTRDNDIFMIQFGRVVNGGETLDLHYLPTNTPFTMYVLNGHK